MSNVYTCTMNLAIDLFVETEELRPFAVNRTIDDDVQANGKGVNVSLVMKQLGIQTTALGFKAGFTGNYIEDFLLDKEILTDFISVAGITRINVFTKVRADKLEYKLVNPGPFIEKDAQLLLLKKIADLQEGDYLCISGSLPKGISPQILIKISEICEKRQVKLIMDTSYGEVMNCLKHRQFLLKPNEEELEEWFGEKINKKEDYLKYGRCLIQEGAEHVLLSLGGEGAYLFEGNHIFYGNSPKGKVVNSACAGDTLLATFLTGMLKGYSTEDNLRKSIAAGSSTAFTKGLTDFHDVEDLEKQIKIIKEEFK